MMLDAVMSDDHQFELTLRIGQVEFQMKARVPAGAMSLADFLPMLWSLSDLTAEVAAREAAALGKAVRCGPRCGACCRQLVPITPPEAVRLRDTLAGLASDHRERVLARVRAAAARLAAAGLAGRLGEGLRTAEGTVPDRRSLGLAYFDLGLACPFLEDESCSIHAERPLACREYLVVSNPIHCARPAADTVAVVDLPRRLSVLCARLNDELAGPDQAAVPAWLPLVLAIDEGASDTVALDRRALPGPELFERLIRLLGLGE